MLKVSGNWFHRPTKRQVTIFTLVWLMGVTCLVIAMTGFFSKGLLQRKYFINYFMILFSLISVLRCWNQYWKQNNKKKVF